MTHPSPAALVSELRKMATTRANGGPAWALYEDAADLIEQLSARAEKLQEELASVKYSASDHEISLGIIEDLRAQLQAAKQALRQARNNALEEAAALVWSWHTKQTSQFLTSNVRQEIRALKSQENGAHE